MKTRILTTGAVLMAAACAFGQTPEPTYDFPSAFEPNPGLNVNRTGCMTVFTPLAMEGTITFSRAGNTSPLAGWGSAGGGGFWQGVGQGYAQYQGGPFTAHKFWPALGDTPGPISIDISRTGSGPVRTKGGYYDPRTDEQRANAPKVSIGAPGGEDGFMKFGLFGNGLRIAAAGRISDPGHPINPGGLELQFDENGVRKSVSLPMVLDGTFHFDGVVAWGPNGPSGRPLLLYHLTAGDEINVGYYGNGTEVERKRELKTFQYDALRNKVSEAVKAEPGRFRHIRTNGVTLGVRG